MDMDTLTAASETLLDVCLPDGAMGTVEGYGAGAKGRMMVTVCGYCGGHPFTRRVPLTAVTASVALERHMNGVPPNGYPEDAGTGFPYGGA